MAADILDLNPYLKRYPRQLSGGQRQRVAMGRAIVRNPQVFLFDEPLSNLDAKLRVQMRTEIKELHQRLKTTTIYVTHDQIEAMTMGDRVAVLRPVSDASESNLQQCSAPRELYENPVNLFVAGFIGSPTMNFLPAALARDGTAAQLAAGLMLPFGDGRRPGADGDRLIIGIRPEHLRPGAGLDLVIDLIEPLGSETLVHGHLSGGEEQSLTVKLFGPPPPGDRRDRARPRQGCDRDPQDARRACRYARLHHGGLRAARGCREPGERSRTGGHRG